MRENSLVQDAEVVFNWIEQRSQLPLYGCDINQFAELSSVND